MRVLGKRILVEQTMKKKQSFIHKLEKTKEENVDITFKIIQVGIDCPKEDNIKVGDIPIFSKHVTFEGAKVVSGSVEKGNAVLHTIVFYDDLIGIDD